MIRGTSIIQRHNTNELEFKEKAKELEIASPFLFTIEGGKFPTEEKAYSYFMLLCI